MRWLTDRISVAGHCSVPQASLVRIQRSWWKVCWPSRETQTKKLKSSASESRRPHRLRYDKVFSIGVGIKPQWIRFCNSSDCCSECLTVLGCSCCCRYNYIGLHIHGKNVRPSKARNGGSRRFTPQDAPLTPIPLEIALETSLSFKMTHVNQFLKWSSTNSCPLNERHLAQLGWQIKQ